MSRQRQKRAEDNKYKSFRPTKNTRQHLEELMSLWGESQTQVINRIVERVHAVHIGVKDFQDGGASSKAR